MMVFATSLLWKLIDVLSGLRTTTLFDLLSARHLIGAFVFRISSIPRNSASRRSLFPNCYFEMSRLHHFFDAIFKLSPKIISIVFGELYFVKK